MEYIAFGPWVWGRGATIAEAKRNVAVALRGTMRAKQSYTVVVYEVGPDTTVDGMGGMGYPHNGPKPREVERIERKARK